MFDKVKHGSQHISELGYTFSHSPYPGHPGSLQLEINFNQDITLSYFEPINVHASIFTEKHEFGTIVIKHPWSRDEQVRYRPGLIRITNHQGEIVDAYSLGGELRIESSKTQTKASFISGAPIFPKINEYTVSSFIANELEDIIAMLSAHWLGKTQIFEQKLWDLPVENVYFLCIKYLIVKSKSDFNRDQVAVEFKHFLHNENERLQGSYQFEGSIENLLEA